MLFEALLKSIRDKNKDVTFLAIISCRKNRTYNL